MADMKPCCAPYRPQTLVLLAVALFGTAMLGGTSRRLLLLQARLVFGLPPAHPHWRSPWARPGSCSIPLEPDLYITGDDYAWLVQRDPDDCRAWLAAAAAQW